MRSRWIEYQGKRILYCDYAGLPVDELVQELDAVEQLVLSQPQKSVLELTVLDEVVMVPPIIDALRKSQARKNPYVIREAVVSNRMNAPKRTLLELVSRLSGQPMGVYETHAQAQLWLVQG